MDSMVQKLRDTGVIPVIALEEETQALPLAQALLEGGIAAAEVTFRTAAAPGAIRRMAKAHPEMLVCAGTVLTVDQAKEAVDCGAQAIVSPGTNPKVVEWCLRENVPVYPGVATPTEVEAALALGLTTLKLFPAQVVGGVSMGVVDDPKNLEAQERCISQGQLLAVEINNRMGSNYYSQLK